jgi:hypothetical protein
MSKLIFVFLLFPFIAHAQLTLSDLGIDSKTEVPQFQLSKHQMEVRHDKLKKHEVLGLTTLGLMTATLFTGNGALDSETHKNLGILTGAFYFATAYYSLTAPKPEGMKDKGKVKWHKALAWIHFPAMILAPIMGYMYKKNEDEGKKHSAFERQHKTVAGILYGSFALSATIMVIEF